jgi:hypothetical protein
MLEAAPLKLLLIAVGVAIVLWRVILWLRALPTQPNPWDEETEMRLH